MAVDTLIGLGSNLGDRESNLLGAVRRLEDDPDIQVRALSPVYRSAPMGPALHEFLNAALLVSTDLDPAILLERLQICEREAGRPEDHERWGPRVLDLDVLTMGALVRPDPPPILPHPGLGQRDFVLRPCLDLVPDLRDPVRGAPLAETLASLTERTLIGEGSALPREIEYEILEHTADMGIAVGGCTPRRLYENAAMALCDAIVPRVSRRESEVREVRLDAPDRESLLVALLCEVVYLMDAKGLLPVRVSVRTQIGDPRPNLRAILYCDGFEPQQVRAAPKAVTHHRVRVDERDGGDLSARYYVDL